MDELKPSKIICKDCGYESNVISDVCIKCGGKLVKVCGNCGTENSVEKIYCDSCGSLLALTPHKKIDKEIKNEKEGKVEKSNINIEFEPITETMLKKEDSYRKKKEEKDFKSNDKKEISVIEEKRKIEEYVLEKEKKEVEQKKDSTENNFKKKNNFFIYLGILSIIFLIFLLYFFVFKKSISKYNLIITAKTYLTYLKDSNYEKAYYYLSNNSKSLISIDDYVKTLKEHYSNLGEWDFKDLSIYYYSENQSIIKYRLFEKGKWRDDYINFIKEYGVWRRPYVWDLFQRIDKAFADKDFSKALYYSQQLYLIDPIDPRSYGYLCWSEYMMMFFDKSVESCKKVIEVSNLHPIKYYNDEDIFWYKFNYADSLRMLNKDDEALDYFTILENYDGVPLSNKCGVYTARSDIFIHKNEYEKALSDLNIALSICKDNSLINDITKRISMLKGDECNLAINFLKKYKYNNERFDDYVNKITPNVIYSCRHLNGPIYEVKVLLKKKSKLLGNYICNIDLWNRTASVKEVYREEEI